MGRDEKSRLFFLPKFRNINGDHVMKRLLFFLLLLALLTPDLSAMPRRNRRGNNGRKSGRSHRPQGEVRPWGPPSPAVRQAPHKASGSAVSGSPVATPKKKKKNDEVLRLYQAIMQSPEMETIKVEAWSFFTEEQQNSIKKKHPQIRVISAGETAKKKKRKNRLEKISV